MLYSYVLPNSFINNEIPLSNYLVPLDSIERAAGFLLFDKIPKTNFKQINGKQKNYFLGNFYNFIYNKTFTMSINVKLVLLFKKIDKSVI